MYYELIKASIIGDAHGLKLVMEIPLKTAAQIFTMYRMIALPTKFFNDTFAKYKLDSDFFVLANDQRDYLLMTEADARKRTTGSVTVWPADKARLDVQTLTSESVILSEGGKGWDLPQKPVSELRDSDDTTAPGCLDLSFPKATAVNDTMSSRRHVED
jgi:hypothetical protein